MAGLSERPWVGYPQRARDELAQAWDHLVAAAEHGGRNVGEASRQRGAVARERAALAALALRGRPPASRWRWAAAGLAVGVVLGAAAAAALRRPESHPEPEERVDAAREGAVATAGRWREQAGEAAAAVRGQASSAAEGAAAAARKGAARVRDQLTRDDQAGGADQPASKPKKPARESSADPPSGG